MRKPTEAQAALSARAAAAEALRAVISAGVSLDAAWPGYQARVESVRDQAFARELVSGTLRWLVRLQFMLRRLVDRNPGDARTRAVLLTGLYQLAYTRVAEHAAISESVATVRALGRPRASGFVNAVLRRFQREREALAVAADETLETRYAYPGWFCERVASDWPDAAERLLAAGNERAPMWLRVNTARVTREQWCTQAGESTGTRFSVSPVAATAVHPAQPLPVEALPGFAEGLVSVQDAGAQLAAALLELAPGMRVLDACAAPGGKSAHMLESAAIALTAVDHDAARLQRLHENLARLGLEARVVHGDAADPSQWWDGNRFDRILLDVPCSASGVVRRHPDIKVLRRAADIDAFALRQRALLEACFPLLAPGGRLVYSTCSIFAAENAGVVAGFVQDHTGVRIATPSLGWGTLAGPGRQILTGEAGMDGFYYSCLEHA